METELLQLDKEKLTLIIMSRYFGIKPNGSEVVTLSKNGIKIRRIKQIKGEKWE